MRELFSRNEKAATTISSLFPLMATSPGCPDSAISGGVNLMIRVHLSLWGRNAGKGLRGDAGRCVDECCFSVQRTLVCMCLWMLRK